MEYKLSDGLLKPNGNTRFVCSPDKLRNLYMKCKTLISRFDNMSDCFLNMSNRSITQLYYYNRDLSRAYSELCKICSKNSCSNLGDKFEILVCKIENLHDQILSELTTLKKEGVEFISGNGIKVLVNKLMNLHQETLLSLR